MEKVLRFLKAWVAGFLVVTISAILFQTQNLLARLSGLGADISFSERISMSAYDLFHLGSVYIWFIAGGAFVAYLVGLLIYRLAGFGRPLVFAVAGAVAMAVMLWAMKQAFFGVDLIAGARDTVGYLFQLLAGAMGGLVFAWLSRSKTNATI